MSMHYSLSKNRAKLYSNQPVGYYLAAKVMISSKKSELSDIIICDHKICD